MIDKLPENKKIILFDGVCNLCDNMVRYVIRQDHKDLFRFVSLQSDLGREIMAYLGIDPSKTDSIILYEPGLAYYVKAGAALRIARLLGGATACWAALGIFPKPLLDWGYDLVARNRYSWYGKKEECLIPTSEIKNKFL